MKLWRGIWALIVLWRHLSWSERVGLAVQALILPVAIMGVFMQGRTHLLAGAAIGLSLSHGLDIVPALAMVGAAAVGALLPDIDHPRSMISRRVGLAGAPVRLLVRHRGVLHSGVAAALVVLAALALPQHLRTFGVAGALGFISHIVLDGLTVQGVPLFWPRRGRVSLLPLRTGGLIERIGALGLLCLICWMIWGML